MTLQQKQVAELTKDMRFEGFLLVRTSEQRTGSNGGKYLDLNLSDKSGEINAKLWDAAVAPPPAGSVAKVRGLVLEYNGRLQLRIEKLRARADEDDVDMSALTASAPEKPEDMLAEVMEAARGLASEPLRRIVLAILTPYEKRLLYYPAAQRIHHAELGGLLHHTTGMLRVARAVLPLYPFLNAELVVAGVLIHDLCKVEELDSDALGVVRDYTESGLLLGHIVMGVSLIGKAAAETGVEGEPVLLLQHMMLSHHGEEAYGSPRKPMFPEAELLHWLDVLDARMNEMQGALSKLRPGVFSEKIWSLERRLYRPRYDELGAEAGGAERA